MDRPGDLTALMELASSLRDVLPIHILTEDDRRELAASMRHRRYKADEVIYHRGDSGIHANVVYAGLVKVTLLDASGREALVALHGRGEFFGELALFKDDAREATVTAVTPTEVFQLTRDACWRVMERNPHAREWMFHHLASTIQRLADRYESVVFLPVPGRLAKYLLELENIGGELPITQEDIASAIGSTRVTVNKLLADFEKRGMVKVERRKFEILDQARLRQELVRASA